jgi:tRNA pseudouridine38-40 synthase
LSSSEDIASFRVAALISYDGTSFHGFARQPGLRTIEGEISDLLNRIKMSHREIVCAGRTDAGVHAAGQVVHVDFCNQPDVDKMTNTLNKLLRPEICVKKAVMAPEGFHARFSAVSRSYVYFISWPSAPLPFYSRYVWHVGFDLDTAEMKKAAGVLVGEHDFSNFCKVGHSGSPIKNVLFADLILAESLNTPIIKNIDFNGLIFRIKAPSFCHQMVRSLVGFLILIGRGKLRASDLERALRADVYPRYVAPPNGLFLEEVTYGIQLGFN